MECLSHLELSMPSAVRVRIRYCAYPRVIVAVLIAVAVALKKRYPFTLAGPELLVLILIETLLLVIAGWFSILAIHLAFQHANLDHRVGPFRHVLGVAQLHRWHHRQRYGDAQVNFGEFWLVWDHLFGTFSDPNEPLDPIGL